MSTHGGAGSSDNAERGAGMTPEQERAISDMPDGLGGWAMVRFVTDGGSLRIGNGDGELLDPQYVQDVQFDPAQRTERG